VAILRPLYLDVDLLEVAASNYGVPYHREETVTEREDQAGKGSLGASARLGPAHLDAQLGGTRGSATETTYKSGRNPVVVLGEALHEAEEQRDLAPQQTVLQRNALFDIEGCLEPHGIGYFAGVMGQFQGVLGSVPEISAANQGGVLEMLRGAIGDDALLPWLLSPVAEEQSCVP
jgi:hypothetical protein